MNRLKRHVAAKTSRTLGLVGVALAAAAMMLVTSTGVANAAVALTTVGDFSNRSTAVKRLANCAASAWYHSAVSGGQIPNCASADRNPYWDQSQLSGLGPMKLVAQRVGYQNGNCPRMSGFTYIKCFYAGGKQKGGVAMTVSVRSSGISGMEASVDWYYL